MKVGDFLDDFEDDFSGQLRLTPVSRNRKKNRFVNGVEERICTRCKKWLPLDQYYKMNKHFSISERPKKLYQAKCKPCMNTVSVRYAKQRRIKTKRP